MMSGHLFGRKPVKTPAMPEVAVTSGISGCAGELAWRFDPRSPSPALAGEGARG